MLTITLDNARELLENKGNLYISKDYVKGVFSKECIIRGYKINEEFLLLKNKRKNIIKKGNCNDYLVQIEEKFNIMSSNILEKYYTLSQYIPSFYVNTKKYNVSNNILQRF